MTCREVEARFVDLQDGRLGSADELRLHAHVEGCAECRARLATWQALLPLMRGAEPSAPSALALRRLEVGIERRLAQQQPPVPSASRRWWAAIGAAAAVALALGGAWLARAPRALDERVVLAAGESRRLQLGGRAEVRITGPARLRAAGIPGQLRLIVEEGRLEARVEHRRADESFVVEVPGGRVEVRGTRFVVDAARQDTSLRVDEGRVAVFDDGGGEHSVAAGESYHWRRGPLAAPAPLEAPAVAAPPPPAPETPPLACAPNISCRAVTATARKQLRDHGYGRALDTIAGALHQGACTQRLHDCRDELGYLDAEALRLSGRTEAAVAAYKTLNRRDSPGATRQNALYAAAQLERRMGRLDAARGDFTAAYAAAPAGALADEALAAAMRSAEAAGDAESTQALARRYLALFPTGLAAAEARREAGLSP